MNSRTFFYYQTYKQFATVVLLDLLCEIYYKKISSQFNYDLECAFDAVKFLILERTGDRKIPVLPE